MLGAWPLSRLSCPRKAPHSLPCLLLGVPSPAPTAVFSVKTHPLVRSSHVGSPGRDWSGDQDQEPQLAVHTWSTAPGFQPQQREDRLDCGWSSHLEQVQQAPGPRQWGSVPAAHGLSCALARAVLPHQAQTHAPTLAGGFSSTVPPGKSFG